MAEAFPNGYVTKGLEKYFHEIAGKPTLNYDLLLHKVATWRTEKIPSKSINSKRNGREKRQTIKSKVISISNRKCFLIP